VELDLQPLIGQFYDYFLDLYHRQAQPSTPGPHADVAKPGQPFLAFGNIGTPVTPEMFQLQDGSPSVSLVQEQFSALANLLPELDGTTILSSGLLTADGAYGALLAQAQPLGAADMTPLGALKGPAAAAFDQASALPLIHGGQEYRPAFPMPADWPLPSGEAAWSSYSLSSEQRTNVTPSPPASPGPSAPHPPWRWRVAPPELRGSMGSVATVATTVKPAAPPAPAPATAARVAILRTPHVLNTAAKPAVAAQPLAASAHSVAMPHPATAIAGRGELLVRQPPPVAAPPPPQFAGSASGRPHSIAAPGCHLQQHRTQLSLLHGLRPPALDLGAVPDRPHMVRTAPARRGNRQRNRARSWLLRGHSNRRPLRPRPHNQSRVVR
jgi:hypothetical protein